MRPLARVAAWLCGALAPVAPLATVAAEPAPDWAGLALYREANARAGKPAPGERRVIFMGDSITDAWPSVAPDFFAGRPYLGRGASGQTTAQMLVRFRQDVLALAPRVVVLLAGTNDVAENQGPYREDDTFANLASMVDLARAHGIEVVLASVLPARDYPWRPGLAPAAKIVRLNARLRDLAASQGLVYADLHGPMADDDGGLKRVLADDGIHPNRAGYEVMGPIVERAIAKALGRE